MVKKATSTTKKKAGSASINFDTVSLVKRLLAEVPDRAREVLTFRFGLGTSPERQTLEEIGERWNITRERVRQIESAGLDAVRNSKAFEDATASFEALRNHI